MAAGDRSGRLRRGGRKIGGGRHAFPSCVRTSARCCDLPNRLATTRRRRTVVLRSWNVSRCARPKSSGGPLRSVGSGGLTGGRSEARSGRSFEKTNLLLRPIKYAKDKLPVREVETTKEDAWGLSSGRRQDSWWLCWRNGSARGGPWWLARPPTGPGSAGGGRSSREDSSRVQRALRP